MVILALETITKRGSIAVLVDRTCHGHAGADTPTHGERLPVELLEWLARYNRTIHDVDRCAVVTGPGSFTGMRVGIASIQGLALAARRPVVGVPTLDALARAWWDSAATHETLFVAVVDGQRGDVFAEVRDTRGAADAERGRVLMPPGVTTPAALISAVSGLRKDAGPAPLVLAGDGALRYADVFHEAWPDATVVDPAETLAEAAAWIAAEHPERAGEPHALRPVYLRRPDAEIARDRASTSAAPASAYAIRRAAITDNLGPVEALQRQTFTNPWGAEAIRWELENTDVARLYVMNAADGALAAYCACWMVFDELHINSLAVDTARRRHGLARALLIHVLDEAVRAGATAATLEVRSSNTAARALYEGLGFKVEGIRRDYYQDPREDAVILWKRGLR